MATLNAQDMAERYGYAYAFLRSNREIWLLFNKAVAANWSDAVFQAQLKNTTWYKTNGEAARQAQFLRNADPATYNAQVAAKAAAVQDMARGMGAGMNGPAIAKMAQDAINYGWDDAQLRNMMASTITATNGVFSGSSAEAADQIRQAAWRNGIRLPESTVQSYVQHVAAGNLTVPGIQSELRAQAKQVAPGFAAQLDSGVDLYDIASPYIQSMSKILEINPAQVDLFDPTIRGALAQKDSKGNSGSAPLWQFETTLRKDPRWLKTQNAQDSLMTNAHQVLKDWGFSS